MLLSAIRDIWIAFKLYTDQAMMYSVVAIVLYLAISLIIYIKRSLTGKRPYSIWYVLFKTCLFAIFGIYSSYLISLTLSGRGGQSNSGVYNIIPFSTIISGDRLRLEAFENYLLFVPFGVLLPIAWKYFRGAFRTSVAGLILSVAIELLQIVTAKGLFDIDDIILNTFGTFTGYILFAGFYYGLLGVKRKVLINVFKNSKRKPPLGKMYDRIVLKHGIVLFIIQLLPIYAWSNIIMGFSSDNGDASGGMSKRLLIFIISHINNNKNVSMESFDDSELLLFYEKILRKMAHMFEYAVLAMLVWICIYSLVHVKSIIAYGAGLVAAFAVGMIDETNQMSVVGRTGTYKDTLIDCIGAIIVLIITGVMMSIVAGYYRRKYNIKS